LKWVPCKNLNVCTVRHPAVFRQVTYINGNVDVSPEINVLRDGSGLVRPGIPGACMRIGTETADWATCAIYLNSTIRAMHHSSASRE
jgi:hypothetical protein